MKNSVRTVGNNSLLHYLKLIHDSRGGYIIIPLSPLKCLSELLNEYNRKQIPSRYRNLEK